jgi:hypothetical protein
LIKELAGQFVYLSLSCDPNIYYEWDELLRSFDSQSSWTVVGSNAS